MDLESILDPDERVFWRGKPNRKVFLLETIFNPMLPFALLWGIIDISFLSFITEWGEGVFFIVPFFLIHLMPVWIYLAGVLFSFRRYRNTNYLVTTKGVYISSGLFAFSYEMKPFTDVSHIAVHRGIFDQKFGVGDVVMTCVHSSLSYENNQHNHGQNFIIKDIPDYQEVFKLIKKLQTDIYADTQYPNDLRPSENHGYNTEYKG